jgi:O-antigen ligase
VWKQIEEMFKIVLPCIVCATLLDSREKLRQLAWVITLSAGYSAWRQNEMYFDHLIKNGNNQIAHTFAIGAGIALFLGFIEQRTLPRLVALACSGLLFHGVLIHMSRGAMLGLGAVGIVGVLLIPKTAAVVRWLFLASVAGLIMAGPSVRTEFFTVFAAEGERDASAESRIELWSAMWDCALRNPVAGVGLQGWPRMASQYGFPPGKQGHGLWAQVLAETGFPGAVLYFSYFAVCILSLLRYAWLPKSETDPEYQLFAIMVIASLSGWIVEEMFGSFYGIELPYYVAAMGIGILRLTTVREPVWQEEYSSDFDKPLLATQRGATSI